MSTPPTPDLLMEMMRRALIEDPEQNATIFCGTQDQDILMPCTGHPSEMLALLGISVHMGALPKPDWIAIMTDSYSIVSKDGEKLPSPMRPGLLAELFAAGDPRVKESIMALCIAPDGPSYARQQKYTRATGEFVWDEPEDLPTEAMGGAVTNGMRRVLGMESVVLS